MEFLKIIVGAILIGLSQGCTEVILRAKDGSITIGRTVDAVWDLEYAFNIEPKGTEYQSVLASDSCTGNGAKWISKHKIVIIRPTTKDLHAMAIDGINDAGLSASVLKLPGHALYQKLHKNECSSAISQIDVLSYILANFVTVAEVKEAMFSGNFPDVVGNVLVRGVIPPIHFSVTDKTGNAIVIEYTASGRDIYTNTIGVVTNAPTYDWHMKQYVTLTNKLQPTVTYSDAMGNQHTVTTIAGSGLLGLPGDFTSSSRFVRAATMLQYSNTPDTSDEAIVTAFHIASTVNTVKGTVVSERGLIQTYWQLAKDMTNLCIYYRTYKYLSIRRLCLNDVPDEYSVHLLNDKKNFKETFEDVSNKGKTKWVFSSKGP